MPDNIARLICKAWIQVHLHPYNTIKSQLVHPKDKVKKDKAGVVHKIKCTEWESKYVGETKCTLCKCSTEHHRHIPRWDTICNIGDTPGRMCLEHQVMSWFEQGVAKSIHIMLEELSLNRD